MKSIKLLATIIPLFFITVLVQAQNKEIKGKITDQATGLPLSGASVLLNNNTGVATKEDGTYTISVGNDVKAFKVSFVGYVTQNITINGRKVINITLNPEVNQQNDVVVIGYGTQKKSSLTGAISKFKNEKLDEAPVSRVDQALQGKIAGLNIQNTSSESGAAPKISIRGISSLNAGASPLIVIDGLPVPDGLSFLNPADVESIEVLKDAASAAIYGSRGASGVIMVTTKKGTTSKPKYTFKYSAGQKKAYTRYDIMTTEEYAGMLFNEMKLRSTDPTVVQSTNTVVDGDRASYIIENELRNGESTDWQSQSLRAGKFTNVQLGATGGSKDVRYYVSGGYQNDEGMMNKSNYEKFNISILSAYNFSLKLV